MSILLLFIFFAVILVMIEITTLILESTGLAREVARFQAISLLTGTGYTTTEAELITKHPVRRKVAEMLIIFGTLAIAIMIAIFLNFLQQEFVYSQMVGGIIILTIVFLLFRLRWVQKVISKRVRHGIERNATIEEVYQLEDEEVIAEIKLTRIHQHLYGTTLAELNLVELLGIYILTIQRPVRKSISERRAGANGSGGRKTELIRLPTGSSILHHDDLLRVVGKKKNIETLFGKSSVVYK